MEQQQQQQQQQQFEAAGSSSVHMPIAIAGASLHFRPLPSPRRSYQRPSHSPPHWPAPAEALLPVLDLLAQSDACQEFPLAEFKKRMVRHRCAAAVVVV
jgi:hypothetical protein